MCVEWLIGRLAPCSLQSDGPAGVMYTQQATRCDTNFGCEFQVEYVALASSSHSLSPLRFNSQLTRTSVVRENKRPHEDQSTLACKVILHLILTQSTQVILAVASSARGTLFTFLAVFNDSVCSLLG